MNPIDRISVKNAPSKEELSEVVYGKTQRPLHRKPFKGILKTEDLIWITQTEYLQKCAIEKRPHTGLLWTDLRCLL